MADFLTRYSQWGLVAGAAEGIGAAYCEELAKKGMNVILVDMKKDEMEAHARHLENTYGIITKKLLADLSDPGAPAKCMDMIMEVNCRLLIYNAAYSRVKPFLSAAPDELDLYVNVNARTPVRLVHAFAAYLKQGTMTGGILLMSSLAGLWGTRLVASYSGTKAFNLALAEALHHELKPSGIDVHVVCAGATASPGYLETRPSYGFIRPSVMKPERVAAIAIRNLGKKTLIIPGTNNKMSYFLLSRILPRSVSSFLVNNTMARTFKHKMHD